MRFGELGLTDRPEGPNGEALKLDSREAELQGAPQKGAVNVFVLVKIDIEFDLSQVEFGSHFPDQNALGEEGVAVKNPHQEKGEACPPKKHFPEQLAVEISGFDAPPLAKCLSKGDPFIGDAGGDG